MSRLEVNGLYKHYGAVSVLRDVSLDVPSGEFVVFVGPSGCGKSTLLRCISGLEDISAGTLAIDGKPMNNIAPAKRGIAMVFQSYALYPHMTVYENITYALRLQGMSKTERRERALEVAKKLQLEDYLDRLPKALSGGQRQRVAIGRAIVRNPSVFLFDEPLSNLDASLRVQMRIELVNLKHQLPHTTMIYVTHDQVEAMTMADRIVVLRDGLVEQVGKPLEVYEQPKTKFVAGFIGSPKMNFLEGEYADAYGATTIGVRPEDLLMDENGPWTGTVRHLERLGSDTYAYVQLETGEMLTIRVIGNTSVRVLERVRVGSNGKVHRFDLQGAVTT